MSQQNDPKQPITEVENYSEHYSETGLKEKLQKVAKRAGVKVVYYVLVLYYALQSPATSKKDRTLIIGSLGYFILPTDLLPDFLIGLGYTDDLGVLAWAVWRVLQNITPEIKAEAEQKLTEWFGAVNQEELTMPTHEEEK
ncbi:MAG: DUF1232 domain-containing protein [Alistipes sp.]|nr:DUF1232 domain-containing protein [Alistipes sp.]